MFSRRLLFALLFALFGPLFSASAADAQTITDERAWLTVTMQGPVGADTKWRWLADTILRSRDGLNDLEVLSLRG